MSKKLFFGSNLKMYKNIKDTVSYLQDLESLTKDISRDEIELFIIPSYTTLDSASKAIDQKNIRLGAQNMCWEEQGQFTGEISPLMLQEAGIGLVMIGHSECTKSSKQLYVRSSVMQPMRFRHFTVEA